MCNNPPHTGNFPVDESRVSTQKFKAVSQVKNSYDNAPKEQCKTSREPKFICGET